MEGEGEEVGRVKSTVGRQWPNKDKPYTKSTVLSASKK